MAENENELMDKAKELVTDVEAEISKLKKEGKCLTNYEALNFIDLTYLL